MDEDPDMNGHPLPHTEPSGPAAARNATDEGGIAAALHEILEESRSVGFLGPGPVEPHVLHARALIPQVGTARLVLDLGSGGGLPGLVLASELDIELVLLDAMQRRCRFLARAVDRLSLGHRVSVRCGRAERLAREPQLRHRFDLVVARSFGPPAVTAECAAGFLEGPASRVLISEPPGGDPDRWPHEGLRELGLSRGGTTVTPHATVQELVATVRCSDSVPRRDGVPAKRPLF